MKPNRQVVKALQDYDSKLFVKWNNRDSVWEVYRKMPWGNRLITPITCNIYNPGAPRLFEPLDYRILDWIYYADSQRKDLPLSWKWKARRRFFKNHDRSKRNFKLKLKHAAKDYYYLINNEIINPQVDETDWKRPELQGKSTKRTMYRKEFYEYDGDRSN